MTSTSRPWLAATAVLGIMSGACSGSPEPPPISTNLLAQFSRAPSFWQQFEVAQEIVKAGDAGILADLTPWLANEDRHLRGNAAFVFAKFGDPRGFETIRAMLTDRSHRPLGSGIPGGSFNPSAPDWWLASQIHADRYYAVHLLGLLKDPRAVDLLVPLLDDPEINYHAAWALGEIGDRRAVTPLNAALKNPNAQMRTSATEALEKLKTQLH